MRVLKEWVEVLSVLEINRQRHEVCACLSARYDHSSRELVLYRDTFLRRADAYGPEEHRYPAWLPNSDCVRSVCAPDHADRLARTGFQQWSKQVLSSVPEDTNEPELHPVDDIFDREVWEIER